MLTKDTNTLTQLMNDSNLYASGVTFGDGIKGARGVEEQSIRLSKLIELNKFTSTCTLLGNYKILIDTNSIGLAEVEIIRSFY